MILVAILAGQQGQKNPPQTGGGGLTILDLNDLLFSDGGNVSLLFLFLFQFF